MFYSKKKQIGGLTGNKMTIKKVAKYLKNYVFTKRLRDLAS